MSTLILGLDLSMNSTGYAVVSFEDDNIEVIKKGLIKKKGNESHSKRLKRQHRKLTNIKEEYKDEGLVIAKEGLHYSRPKTSAILGKVHGVVDIIFPRIATYGASTIKKEVAGKGNASKQAVEEAVKNMLQLDITFKSDDESDAVAVAITHYLKKKRA